MIQSMIRNIPPKAPWLSRGTPLKMSAVKSSAIFIGLYKKPELKAKVKLHRKLSYESLKMPD